MFLGSGGVPETIFLMFFCGLCLGAVFAPFVRRSGCLLGALGRFGVVFGLPLGVQGEPKNVKKAHFWGDPSPDHARTPKKSLLGPILGPFWLQFQTLFMYFRVLWKGILGVARACVCALFLFVVFVKD